MYPWEEFVFCSCWGECSFDVSVRFRSFVVLVWSIFLLAYGVFNCYFQSFILNLDIVWEKIKKFTECLLCIRSCFSSRKFFSEKTRQKSLPHGVCVLVGIQTIKKINTLIYLSVGKNSREREKGTCQARSMGYLW